MATNPFAQLFAPLVTPMKTSTTPSIFAQFRPKNPVSPFNLGQRSVVTPARPNSSVPLSPYNSQSSATALTPGQFGAGPFATIKPDGTSVPSAYVTAAPSRPVTPQVTAPRPTAPVAPVAPTPAVPTPAVATPQASQNAPQTPQTPPTPQISPEIASAVALAEEAFRKSSRISPDELSTQEDIDKLVESTQKAYLDIRDKPIPLEFITGQLASVERRALALAEPLERKMARLQAARQSAVEGSKFALERADKALEAERTRVRETIVDAESRRRFDIEQAGEAEERKTQREQFEQSLALDKARFEEDKRQFGLNYALSQQKQAQEAAEKTKAAGDAASETLDNYSLINELLGTNTNAIAGVPGVSSFFPGTQAQTAKNLAKQVNAVLSLDNRQKLKGSGAISDFEARTLSQAASSLGIDPESGRSNLSNEEFKKQLRKVRGAFATSAGLSASVRVTDPKTGKVDDGSLTRDQIDSAISQGFTVEYQ